MSRFERNLKILLKKEHSFVDKSGELLTDVVCDRAWKLDHSLIELLLADQEVKNKFFDRIRDELVFNHNTFVDYLRDINFLDSSYTRFRNQIGLNIDGKFLRERGEVSLVWPYKDCVLEGGQTKEEEKRDEIFFNEILAHDEINRLLDPKVLTSWKRHTANGLKKVQEIKRDESGMIRENMLIKGNNLLALHSLVEQFRGKVKLIYIDPPYNTGNDSFGYNNRFNHSSWLTFMKNRLEIARELLCDDGVIFVQCDDNEQMYLKVLMDEIFGDQNFVSNSIAVVNRAGRDYASIARTHEYLLAYSKIPQTNLNKLEESNKKFDYTDENGGFNLANLKNNNVRFNVKNRPNLCYPLYVNLSSTDSNGLLEVSLEKQDGFIEVMPPKSQGVQMVWRWGKEKVQQNLNIEIKGKIKQGGGYMIVQKYRKSTKRQRSIWDEKEFTNDRGTKHLKELFTQKVFDYPKSEHLVARVIELGSNKGDIVLDFFTGSGTTAAVAHKMNRQWIAVEQMDYIETITVERLNKVIEGEQGGISKSVDWQGGGDYIYCELMPYAQTYVDRIQQARTSEELEKLRQEICRSSFLNWYISNNDPAKASKMFVDINDTEQQRQLLMDLLDKNQLYVHHSEIDDVDYKVSSHDKKLNELFYGK